jgi:hypothetical protein
MATAKVLFLSPVVLATGLGAAMFFFQKEMRRMSRG